MLHDLSAWLVDWADSPLGPAALFILSFAESIVFPIPPDPLLIALALRNTDAALAFAGVTTAGSVLGGIAGHWLGGRFGTPMLRRLDSGRVERVGELLRRHGFWAIVLAGLTPIPYKVFTIAAGVFELPRTQFIVASIIGRGARFFLIGGLIFLWGDRLQGFLEERLDIVLVVFGVLLIVALAIWLSWERRSPKTADSAAALPRHDDPHRDELDASR